MRLRKLREIVKADIPIFDFDYPMLAEHRAEFERKFILNFYDYFINFESITEFKIHLQSRLLNIMPRYLKLYQTENMITDPFVNFFTKITQNEQEDKKLIDDYIESLSAETLNKLYNALQSIQNNVSTITASSDTSDNSEKTGNATSTEKTIYEDNETYKRDLSTTINENNTQKTDETNTAETNEKQTTETNEHQETDGETVEKFSDTPQVNFVVGNGIKNADGSYTPISTYATTLTDTTNNTTSDKNSDETINKDSTGNGTIDRTMTEDNEKTEKTVISDTKNNDGNKTVTTESDTTENSTASSNTNSNSDTTENITLNQSNEKRDITKSNNIKASQDDKKEKTERSLIKNNKGFQNENISKLLTDYRKTLINIDEMVFNDCRNLFLGVWI